MAEGLIRGFRGLKTSGLRECPGTVATVGAFDGLHLGHQRLLNQVVEDAKQRGLRSVAITFEPLPKEYFSPEHVPARLMSFREKFEGLRQLGIDYVLLFRFDDNMRTLDAEEFAERLFIKSLRARKIVIGDDFRFGAGGKGDFALLQSLMLRTGAEVIPTQSETVDGERVSSSLIRASLDEGDFVKAEALLGRPYQITGKVFYGQQLGRQLGFPTANVQLRRMGTATAGVYAVEVALGAPSIFGQHSLHRDVDWIPAVANVGTRPTVSTSEAVTLEVHLLNFEKTIYGQRITVRFRHKIREEKKFDGVEGLKAQIAKDKQTAIDFFAAR